MSISEIKIGDVVKCDKGGRIFYAVVKDKEKGELKIDPITPNITYFTVKSREVITRYKQMKS